MVHGHDGAQLCAFRTLIGPTLYLGSMARNVQECAGTAYERHVEKSIRFEPHHALKVRFFDVFWIVLEGLNVVVLQPRLLSKLRVLRLHHE